MREAAAALLAAAGLAFLAWRQRGQTQALATRRKHYLDDCLLLFEDPVLSQTEIDYPRLVGRYKGHEVQITPVIDTLSVRKLPSLWLMVTIVAPMPFAATLDVMMRPIGTELFSNFHNLPNTLATPDGWPAGAVLRSDCWDGIPPLSAIEAHMPMFLHSKAKELLIKPKGVRLVWQVAEAVRGYYLVYRQAHFEVDRLDASLAETLIKRAWAIRESLLAAARAEVHPKGEAVL